MLINCNGDLAMPGMTDKMEKGGVKVSLYLVRQSTLQHTVPGYLTHITGAELPQLSCYSVLFHQRFLQSGHTNNGMELLTLQS